MKTCHQQKRVTKDVSEQGFTLIELSIVLVIIGLIVGGVLVGQDLIRAAEVRATISQIEKYNTAVNTFRGKYNALPGDMNATTASAFGFATRGTTQGLGDGNGVIEAGAVGFNQGGETTGFWVDLSVGNPSTPININLIDGSFSTATVSTATVGASSSTMSTYLPAAKLGRGNSVYVFSTQGTNYYGLANISTIAAGVMTATGSMTTSQAYQIDKKVDDGYPLTGNVSANVVTGGPSENAALSTLPVGTVAASDTATSCYNTAAANSTTGAYSVGYNNGASATCALAFRFQ